MNIENHLPEGTLLRGGIYKIVRFLSAGGFGCTYEAIETGMGTSVCIKEFFVGEYCNREADGLTVTVGTQSRVDLVEKLRRKFREEAMRIYGLKHSGVVRVSAVFDENGTSYYAMDFIRGKSLQCIVEERGPLPEAEAVGYIRQVCDALAYVHARNILHLDIKPANIMVDGDGNAILIDFGVSKQYDEANGHNTSTLIGQSPGYAPPEQSNNEVSSFYPATDIYAVGATLYCLLTGTPPPSCTQRIAEGELAPLPANISPATCNAVYRALTLGRKERPQTIDEFVSLLNGQASSATPSGNATKPIDSKDTAPWQPHGPFQQAHRTVDYSQPSRQRGWIWAAAIAALLIFAAAAFFFLKPGPVDSTDTSSADSTLIALDDSVTAVPLPAKEEEKPQPVKEEPQQPTKEEPQQQTQQQTAPVQQSTSVPTTGTTNGHDWVDMGTSVKWATRNVGANSMYDYGDYFAWGETSTKSDYSSSTSKTYGKSMGSIAGNPNYDVARAKWGADWRMPTKDEFQELIDNCTWNWTGSGMKVTAKNGNTIFFPAAGYRTGAKSYSAGEFGDYWSASPSGSDSAFYLYFNSGGLSVSNGIRYNGLSVRPVRE